LTKNILNELVLAAREMNVEDWTITAFSSAEAVTTGEPSICVCVCLSFINDLGGTGHEKAL
jgi:hypothetical protein